MTHHLTCTIFEQPTQSEIEISSGLLSSLNPIIHTLVVMKKRIAIITDDVMVEKYGDKLYKSLLKANVEAFLFSFPNGEKFKTRATKEQIENQMIESGLARDTCIVAVGGGVVTDLAGYVAATYCRGISLILIPTSLLGMVDACIGGKTGVNVPQAKNRIGAFYVPSKVWIDPEALRSLPPQELKHGLIEMIKHGLIADASYVDFLEQHMHALLALDCVKMEKAIFESCQIKKRITEEDGKESGKRRLLNFGHTIGHAIETLSHYTIPHGEAVAIGIVVESEIAMRLGALSETDFKRIYRLIKSVNMPTHIPEGMNIEQIYEAMKTDKKSHQGTPRMVILNGVGSAMPYDGAYCTEVDIEYFYNHRTMMQF